MGEEEEEGRRGAAVMQTTPRLFIYKCDVGGVIKSAGGVLGRSDIMENERKMKRNDKCSPDDSAPFHGHAKPPPAAATVVFTSAQESGKHQPGKPRPGPALPNRAVFHMLRLISPNIGKAPWTYRGNGRRPEMQTKHQQKKQQARNTPRACKV